MQLETRILPTVVLEVRQTTDGRPALRGYPLVWDAESLPLYNFFREVFPRDVVIRSPERTDRRALWAHNPMYIVGREANKTLTITRDDHGLLFEMIPPVEEEFRAQWAVDMVTGIKRGDIIGMSIGFETHEDKWTDPPGQLPLRKLVDVTVHEGSIVGNPAYPDTDIDLRSEDSCKNLLAEFQRSTKQNLSWYQRAQLNAERRQYA